MPTAADTPTDPYLTGAWAPVHDEIVASDLPVTGEIPTALRGAYVRNGPNPAFPPPGRYHLFDGDGMLHSVGLDGGRARYRNRWVESRGLQVERREGRALFGGLAEFSLPPAELMAETGFIKNTANTHIVSHAGRLLALMEAAPPTEVSPALETLGEHDFDGRLSGPMTAHPKIDPETGEMIFFGYNPFPPFLRLHVAAADGTLVASHDIDLPAAVMMHDFAVSRRRVVLFDLPALFDVPAMMAGGSGIRWEPGNGARIGVLDRTDLGAGPRWIEVDPFFVFHFLNAWDDGDQVVVEGCRSPRLNAAFGTDALSEPVRPRLHRWRIDTVRGTVADEPLDDRPGDFPRIDDRRAGLPARYGYIADPAEWGREAVVFDGVVKHDLQTGASSTHDYGEGHAAGEACFAPDPTRDGEDAGWLLNLVTDMSTDTTDLVIVDAETMAETGRVHLPRRAPLGFHGSWFPDLVVS